MKADKNKLNYSLVLPEFIEWDAKILQFGANKYEPNNWMKTKDFNSRYLSAMIRHIIDYMKGEKYDKESGFHHLKHAAICAKFLVWKDLKNNNKDEDIKVII